MSTDDRLDLWIGDECPEDGCGESLYGEEYGNGLWCIEHGYIGEGTFPTSNE